jgi:hypothetical protein
MIEVIEEKGHAVYHKLGLLFNQHLFELREFFNRK